MKEKPVFVDVLLPLPIPKYYTYGVPFDWVEELEVGKRVVVQFGRSKIYSALIRKIHQNPPAAYTAKPIEQVMDQEPVVFDWQFKFWEWIAEYYLAETGEVMNAALPSGFKLSSETKLVANPHLSELDLDDLSDDEYLLTEALDINQELDIADVQAILQKKTVIPVVRSLLDKKALFLHEELRAKYKPKEVNYLQLNASLRDEKQLESAFEDLSRAPKQQEVLMQFLHEFNTKEKVLKSTFTGQYDISASALKSLIDKEYILQTKEVVSRLQPEAGDGKDHITLSDSQQEVMESIQQQFEEKQTVLLYGLTGSGKTSIYIKLIKQYIEAGKQVLYLLPEIALTTQIIQRLQSVFGDTVGVYHSKYSDNERVEIWNKVRNGEYRVVIGARSAMLLPYKDLGFIVVDEEHDGSYKQFDPAPRYHARDAAIVLGIQQEAKILLGSGTPAIESVYNAQSGKFGYAYLGERYGEATLPATLTVDLNVQRKKKLMKGHFSHALIDYIKTALEKKEQVILFQNRRGFAQYLICNTCGWIPYCPNCDVSLTYHKFANKLVCHLCGFRKNLDTKCRACGSSGMLVKGFGTEQLEDDLKLLFPEAKVDRLDYDTARTKKGHIEVIARFENREIDILVGTQMVTKGLDFDHVSLVGILDASNLMSFPTYNASERAYQLLSQVSGRAGRKDKPGTVVIQTNQPDSPILRFVKQNDYEGFYQYEMTSRKQFGYPPFLRLIQLTVRHKKAEVADKAAVLLVDMLKKNGAIQVLGPTIPVISRVKNYFLRDIVIKLPKNQKIMLETKTYIKEITQELRSREGIKSVNYVVNVDPA